MNSGYTGRPDRDAHRTVPTFRWRAVADPPTKAHEVTLSVGVGEGASGQGLERRNEAMRQAV